MKRKVKAKQEKFKTLTESRIEEEVEFNKVPYKTAKKEAKKAVAEQRTMLMRCYIRSLTLGEGRMRARAREG